MIEQRQFIISYFASTHNGKKVENGGHFVVRKGKWIEGCKIFVNKLNEVLMTYWDIDAEHPRTAVNYSVRKA